MKKKTIVALSALLLVSAAGIGTAAAFLLTGSQESVSGEADESILLDWGETSGFADIDDLTPDNPKLLSIAVKKPNKTENSQGTPTFSLTIASNEDSAPDDMVVNTFAGLTIKVSETEFTGDTDPEGTLTMNTGSDPAAPQVDNPISIQCTDDKFTDADTLTFYIQISVDQSLYDTYFAANADTAATEAEETTYRLDANLTASYKVA